MAAYWVLGGNSAPEGAGLYRQLLEDTQHDYWFKEKLDLFESTNQNHENRWKQVNSEFRSWWELSPFDPESIFINFHSFSSMSRIQSPPLKSYNWQVDCGIIPAPPWFGRTSPLFLAANGCWRTLLLACLWDLVQIPRKPTAVVKWNGYTQWLKLYLRAIDCYSICKRHGWGPIRINMGFSLECCEQ